MSKKIGWGITALMGVAIVAGLVIRMAGLAASSEELDSSVDDRKRDPSEQVFKVFVLQSVDSEVELNRFEFPYADIAAKADYASLVGIFSEIPGSRFSADTYTIFRTQDQVPVAFGKEVTAVEGNNSGLLLLPNEAIEALGGPDEAFSYYFERIRQLTDR